jgi:integrase
MIKPRQLRRSGKTVYDVRLRDPAGRVYNRTFPTKKAAAVYVADEEARRARGTWIDPRVIRTPFDELAGRWLEAGDDKRSSTLGRDRGIVAGHLVPAFGSRPVVSISPEDVQKVVNRWARRLAPSTVGRMFSVLRAVMGFAVDAGVIARNPCRRIRLPEAYPRAARILDADELEQLAAAMGVDGAMVFLAVQGLRWGEIAGLCVRHLDLLRHTVVVERQWTKGGDSGTMVEQRPKTRAGARALAIPEWLSSMLADHLAARGLTAADADAPVFASPTGQALRYDNWRARVWLPAVRAVGLDGFTFHDLKHTAATALVGSGVDIRTARARLGHASPVTTLRIYAQATEAADRDAADRVGETLRPRDGRAMVRPRARRRPR